MKVRPEEKILAAKALQYGFRLYRVGGSVRDEICGIEANDWDYVAIGDVSRRFEFVADFEDGNWGCEFPVYRFHFGDLGKVEISFDDADIVGNLRGRDTTMNAMAVDCLTGDLLDPFNGRRDLAMGIVRYVDVRSFNPLAAFRAARQCCQMTVKTGRKFWPSATTLFVMNACMPEEAPQHRIRYEWRDAEWMDMENYFMSILAAANIFVDSHDEYVEDEWEDEDGNVYDNGYWTEIIDVYIGGMYEEYDADPIRIRRQQKAAFVTRNSRNHSRIYKDTEKQLKKQVRRRFRKAEKAALLAI